MKISSPIKRSMTIVGIGLVLSGLAFYSVSALLALEKSEKQEQIFISDIIGKLTLAQTNYKSWLAEGSVNVDKDIITPVLSVKALLQDIYYETAKDFGFEISTAEEAKVLLKLTIVELEKISETVKSKTSDFEKAQFALQGFTNYILNDQQSYRVRVVSIAWSMAWLVLISITCFSILDFIRSRKNRLTLSALEASIQQETKRVQKLTGFIEAIASGNYTVDLNSGDQDELNGTLITMRDRLRKNAEEDQQRNWASTGLAQGGEILRINNAQELYDSVIKFVVKYTASNQGGLFVLTDDDQDKQLELVSCYAYERKKFLSRKVGIGQGMIGQCFLEKEKIHLVEIPEDYVNITSGLGAANPSSLLLIPLKTNDVVYGVLELASFKPYKDHEIEWVERLAESIASTVASVRANENMRQLLEQTQQQAEEMKSQEEEMRQNMEELSATQEEMSRKEREYISRISELETQQQVASSL